MGLEAILALLAQKRDLFLEFERVSNGLCTQAVDELQQGMEQRGALLRQVCGLDEQLRGLCGGDTALRDAVDNRCGRGDLPPDLARVFDASMEVKAVVNRILNGEEATRRHLEQQREQILQKIEAMNSSASAVAEKYRRSVQTGMPQPMVDARDKKI